MVYNLSNLTGLSNSYKLICYKFCEAGYESAFKKLLDPDQH